MKTKYLNTVVRQKILVSYCEEEIGFLRGSKTTPLIVGDYIIFLSINFTAMEIINQIYNAVSLLVGQTGR